jgi:serine kinase of HPr protein (carbohydrate metabolism regulator)
LLVRPAPQLVGLIEVRGIGIRRLPYEAIAAVGLVIDLAAEDAARHAGPEAAKTVISGVSLPRLAVAAGIKAVTLVLASLRTVASVD